MAGYTRQSTFADGDTITAALFNNEYNQLVNAFSNTSGHAHDGTAANGPVIGLIGDAGETAPNNKVVIDTTNNYIEFYVEVSSSPVQQLYIADGAIIPVTDNDIDLGTSSLEFKDLYIDGTAKIDVLTVDEAATIGTTLGVTGATTLSSTLGVTGATTLSSTLGVTGAATLSSTLAVTGTSTLTGNVTASNDLSVGGNLTVTGNATISGNLTFGDADTDSITLTADVASNIVPDVDDTYDLGTATKQWRNLYIDGTAEVDTLSIDGTAVTSTAAELNILDGVTATTAEINTLDGITATVAELNILDGVTSTATELNIMDGDTVATATTLADADRVVVNDAGVMKQVALTDFETYFEGALDTLSNVTTVGALNAGSITSGFGAIDNGSSNITTTGTVTYGSLSDGVITITAFADEDDMVSNSATLVPTQQSVKAYVDAQVATANELSELTDVNLTTPADASLLFYDTLTSKWIDNVVSGDITIADTGVAAISSGVIVNDDINASAAISVSKTALTAGTGLTLSTDTLAIDSTVATLTGTQTLTNKTLTSPVLNTGVSGTAFLDDDTFATATASTLASSESIKAYVDSSVSGISSNSISDADGDTKIQVEESADEDIIRFDTFGTERMVINASGNVGIGTASPSEILEINTSSRFAGRLVSTDATADAGPYLTLFRDSASPAASDDIGGLLVKGNNASGTETSMGIFKMEITDTTAASEDADWVFINRNAGTLPERFRIQANGNVGIGTASPLGKLSVQEGSSGGTANANADGIVIDGSGKTGLTILTPNTSEGLIFFADPDDDNIGRISYNHSTNAMSLVTNNSTALTIDSSQNVGIGTTSPSTSLHVRKDQNSSGNTLIIQNEDSGASAAAVLTMDAQGNSFNLITYGDGTSSANVTEFKSVTGSSEFAFSPSSTEKMRIDSSGNVGIGNTSPQRRLTVGDGSGSETLSIYAGSTSASGLHFTDTNTATDFQGFVTYDHSTDALRFGAAEAEGMRLTSTGLGIGTASPDQLLHISAGADPAIRIENTDTTATAGQTIGKIEFEGQDASTNASGVRALIDAQYAGVGGQGRLKFQLAQENSASLSDSLLLNYGTQQFFTSGSERMRIDSSGNVGIGTTSPQGTIHVKNTSDSATLTSVSDSIVLSHQSGSYTDGNYYGVLGFSKANSNGATLGAAIAPVMDGTGAGTDLTFSTALAAGSCFEKMRITDSGNVGIGTTSPAGVLDLRTGISYNASADRTFHVGANNLASVDIGSYFGYQWKVSGDASGQDLLLSAHNRSGASSENLQDIWHFDASAKAQIFLTNHAERMRIDSSGNLQLGSSSNTSRGGSATKQLIKFGSGQEYLDLQSNNTTTNSAILFSDGSTGNYGAIRYRHNGDSLEFMTAATERMRIDSSGRLMVGVTSAIDLGRTSVEFNGTTENGVVYRTTRSATGSTFVKFRNSSDQTIGYIYQDGSTTVSYFTNSDYRLKENVVYDWTALDRLNQLKPARFNFIGDSNTVDGFLAHEVQDVVPAAIKGVKDEVDANGNPEYQGIASDKLIPLLVKALQEADNKIDALTARIETLENA